MRIVATAGDIDALISHIRLRTPLAALAAKTGWQVSFLSFHEVSRAQLRAADVLVVQRGQSARVLRLEQAMRRAGGAVIYEIDDLLTEIAPHISQFAAVRQRLPWLHECLRAADLVSVSTTRLAQALAPLAGATMLVPNHAYQDGDRPLTPARPGEPVHLLIASSDHLVAPALIQALRQVLSPMLRLVVVGPPAKAFVDCGLPVQPQPLLPRPQFIELARSLVNPLALIPLEDSPFAACKSAIKWFDYAEAGIPTLASAVPPYADVMTDEQTGALVPDLPDAWECAIRRAAADSHWRERVARNARHWVRRHALLEHTVVAWQAALIECRHRRAKRGHEAESPWAAARAALLDRWDDLAIELRALNRRRLAHRADRRSRPS